MSKSKQSPVGQGAATQTAQPQMQAQVPSMVAIQTNDGVSALTHFQDILRGADPNREFYLVIWQGDLRGSHWCDVRVITPDYEEGSVIGGVLFRVYHGTPTDLVSFQLEAGGLKLPPNALALIVEFDPTVAYQPANNSHVERFVTAVRGHALQHDIPMAILWPS